MPVKRPPVPKLPAKRRHVTRQRATIPDDLGPDVLLTIAETLQYTGYGHKWMHRLVQRGVCRGRQFKVPGAPRPVWKVSVADLRAFLMQERPHGVRTEFRESHLAREREQVEARRLAAAGRARRRPA